MSVIEDDNNTNHLDIVLLNDNTNVDNDNANHPSVLDNNNTITHNNTNSDNDNTTNMDTIDVDDNNNIFNNTNSDNNTNNALKHICECGENAAKSSHACDKCHRKMHAYCGQPIGEEGFGQARRCAVCSKVDTISLDKKPTKGRPKTRQDIPGKKRPQRKRLSKQLDLVSPPAKKAKVDVDSTTNNNDSYKTTQINESVTDNDNTDSTNLVPTRTLRSQNYYEDATSDSVWYKEFGV